MANYRIKEAAITNVPYGVTIVGRFTLTTNGAVGVVRPSAGANAPASGAGNMFTVTQLGTFNSGTNANAYQVTLTEAYLQPISQTVNYNPPYSLTALTNSSVLYSAQCTQYDATSNSFVIYMYTEGTVGSGATAPVLTSALAAGEIYFEFWAKNSISPGST